MKSKNTKKLHPYLLHAARRMEELPETRTVAKNNHLDRFTLWAASKVEDFVMERIDTNKYQDCDWFEDFVQKSVGSGKIKVSSPYRNPDICEVCRLVYERL